jgi:ABC-type histidine transport system ATPase subunit
MVPTPRTRSVWTAAVAIAAAGAVALTGCSNLSKSGTSGASGGKTKVGLITKTEANPFFVKMKEGAQKEADAKGVTLMTAAGAFDGDNAGQVTAVENMVAAGVPRMRKEAARQMDELKIGLRSLTQPVENLSGGQRQGVAVARAAAWAQHVVIMDEPTAALGVKESGQVLELIGRVRDRGLPVVLVSHNMPQVFEIADRIHIQRLGRRVGVVDPADHSMSDVVAIMTGAARLDDQPATGARSPCAIPHPPRTRVHVRGDQSARRPRRHPFLRVPRRPRRPYGGPPDRSSDTARPRIALAGGLPRWRLRSRVGPIG